MPDSSPTAELGLTLQQLAEAKRLDPDDLRNYSVTDGFVGTGSSRRPCVDIPYISVTGEVTATHKRVSLAGASRFRWKPGDKTSLYGLWRMQEIRAQGWVLIVEGETDCWSAWEHGLPCLGLPGASTWKREYAELLDGLDVFVWQEPGDAGAKMVQDIGEDPPSIRIIRAPDDAKDISELHIADADSLVERVETLKRSALPLSEIRDAETEKRMEEAKIKAAHLLAAEDILQLLHKEVIASGYAGDTRPALLSYLSITSRVLKKGDPRLNLAYVAQSASGKNAAVDAARQFFPEDAYYLLRAGSSRALIYNEESFEHRALVAFEDDSLPEEGPAASAVRSLISDGVMEYEVTEKDDQGHQRVRKITKPGPTPLITTTTKPLGDQASTRVLNITISDTREQTAAILRIKAKQAQGLITEIDLEPWQALQEYLGCLCPLDVVVPFAGSLAEQLPTSSVRMRRDFSQLLTAIKTLAALRQHQRDRDDQGRIIANSDDYSGARWLLEDVFASTVAGGVTPAVRETVEAVMEIYASKGDNVTETELAARLGLARTGIQYRVNRALDGGWIEDIRQNRHQSRELKPGAPLPDSKALPEPALLCGHQLENDAAVRQEEPSTASPSAAEGAEPHEGSFGSLGTQVEPAEVAAQEVPNPHSAGSTAPSSLAGGAAEPAYSDLEVEAHKEQQMPWDGFLEEHDAANARPNDR